MAGVREWAKRYRDAGLAVCRVQHGQKRPTYKGWNLRSLEPDDFGEGDGIGIQGGRLSGDLWIVDLDSRDALRLADRHLPWTGTVEGRPGKPESHRLYRVVNIPPELSARPGVAGGLGGPINQPFSAPDGTRLIDLIGTGLQAVAPPSWWTNGTATERRCWHSFTEPRVVDASELYDAVCKLAAACGWVPKPTQEAGRGRQRRWADAPDLPELLLPTGEAAIQARAYLEKVPPAVEGEGGDKRTFFAAAVLVVDFGLTFDEALPLLEEWNRRCTPPWTLPELAQKLNAAGNLEGERGWRVRRRSSPVVVSLRPHDPVVFVGVDCAGEHSYVSMPTMRSGHRQAPGGRRLAPELAGIDWQGKSVLLASPSTVTTNAREAWDEYFLARLLARRGAADVLAVRLPPLNGRRRTLATAGDARWDVVYPPRDFAEAEARAAEAKRLARELDPERKSLPRSRASPKLDAAVNFVRQHGISRLTKDVIGQAAGAGITRDTLKRALGQRKKEETIQTSPPPPHVIGVRLHAPDRGEPEVLS